MDLPIKKRKLSELETADTGGSDSLTGPTGTNSGGSCSTPTETTDGASSSSNEPSGSCYEVFLSFSGKDTRLGFTDHLYHGLVDAGIRTFRDNEDLCRGKKIGDDLFVAIKNSKILIPILSVNYGTSSWCLNELVQIMEGKKNNKETIVLPIFYKVEPSDVKYQKGSFGEEFRKREERLRKRKGFDSTILEKWKEALKEVSSLKGHSATGPEGELVKSVVGEVWRELIARFELVIPENLVGIDSHVRKIMKFVDDNSHATIFVGIHGMGGIGKTTLAKTIYNQLLNQFEYHSSIADIREKYKNGVEHLQNKLIRDILKKENLVRDKDQGIKLLSSSFKGKKVLILLDDVDANDHLKDLAGSRDWFSSGSVIIITTRDESILDKARVDYKHDHRVMDKDSSLILFSRHAFQDDAPPSEFVKLTDEVVSTTGGLPLSVIVLGSFLFGQSRGVWEDTKEKSRKFPREEVQEKLRISYDALDYGQKQIFLDIACFFIGTDLRIPSYMWDTCNFYPTEGIKVLRSKSLIKVEENHELRMHDQLRDLGREIVREKGEREPRKCSRLWDSKEVMEVLKDEGTGHIEAIYLRKDSPVGEGDNILMGKQFKKLRNLRFLKANGAHFNGDFKNSIKKLKWLHWKYCPSTFEANNFHVKELRVLDLWGSEISDRWRGWSFITMAKKLKYLDLGCCLSLKKTSFLSAFEELEVLILKNCERIEQIDSSIGNMKKLVRLDLRYCHSLEGLPAEVGKLEKLEQLLLRDCGKISSLPDGIWGLQNLEILDVYHTRIKELPKGIGNLSKLRELDASYCHELEGEVPESIGDLSFLQSLNVYGCKKLQSLSVLPSSLTFLGISCRSHRLPSLSNLTHLKEMWLLCEFLECIWEHPSTPLEKSLNAPFKLEILEIDGSTLLKTLDVSQFSHLRTLSATYCKNLLEIQGLDKLEYLESLKIERCTSIKRLNLPKSKGLNILSAHYCENLVEIQGLDRSEFLKQLDIIRCASIERLNLSKSKGLQELKAWDCKKLVEIQVLDRLESLERIDISKCASIVRLDLSKFEGLKFLRAICCEKLVAIQGLDRLESLEAIEISWCASIVRLDLSKSKGLQFFDAKCCEKLIGIEGLDGLESLEEIDISWCTSIPRLDLPKSKGLKKLSVESCKNLFDIQGLDRLEFLKVLNLSGCTSFGRLPKICCFDTLHKLAINCCDNVHDVQSLERFTSCTTLRIEDYKSLAKFPNLSNFPNLRTLVLSNCRGLEEIPGLEELTSLERIHILGCSSIVILPDLSSFTHLISLALQDCKKLTELRGLEKLEHLKHLDISGCTSLKTPPELSRTPPELSRTQLYRDYWLKPLDQYEVMTKSEEDDYNDWAVVTTHKIPKKST